MPKDSQDLTGHKGGVSSALAQGYGSIPLKTRTDLKEMDWNLSNNKGKGSFFDLQGDDSEEKVPLSHTMKRNLRRSKARAFRKDMKEKSVIEQPRKTPVHIW